MWRKLTSALKHGEQDTTSTSTVSQGDVMGKVLEQHPNLSMFHPGPQENAPNSSSPPPSPTKSRRSMFKRGSRMPSDDDERAPSPSLPKLSLGIPKKVKSSLSLAGNQSQSSLSRASGKNTLSAATAEANRGLSLDLLRSPSSPNAAFDSIRSSPPEFHQRPSIDTLRTLNADADDIRPLTPGILQGSVRSILRDPNTPGTGRNVRFFSRDAYQAVTPEQSTDNEYPPLSVPPVIATGSAVDLSKPSTLSSVIIRPSSSPKNARPSVTEVFSPMRQDSENTSSASPPVPEKDTSNLLDMSQEIQLSAFSPPGLGFDIDLDKALDLPLSDDDNKDLVPNAMTSTPYRGPARLKGKESAPQDSVQPSVDVVDESIFHSKEKSPKLPSILHDRSHSFSFGQTVFFSMADASKRSSTSSAVPSLTSTDTKSSPSPVSLHSSDSPSQSSIRSRSRALSDTVFHSMLRSSPINSKPPEADINDESSSELVVYDPAKPEPDPFSATANTYYTPQTMIPVTPPRGLPNHARKTSREDSIIVSLQTQLALQSELCGQYETDLRARDEMVQILGQKVNDLEKEELKRKGILRAWKKKVAELERTCRFLEEEVEGSRQESMDRSIMDEASGEALRMLHRQIASLERDKGDMARREEALRDEVQALENIVQDRSEEILSLKETVWSRDESQRELQQGLREAQEQIEQIGNISMVTMDLASVVGDGKNDDEKEEERERHRLAEVEWEKQRTEMIMTTEKAKAETVALEGQNEKLRQQLKTTDDELTMLKNELEAQWGHSEKASERIEALEEEKREIEKERHALSGDVEELQERLGVVEGQKTDLENECQSLTATIEQLEERIGNMEVEWEESENRRADLEDAKKALEDEMHQVTEELQQQLQSAKDQVRYKHEHAERIAQTMKESETRIAELELERQYSLSEISRLESNVKQRDADVGTYSSRVVDLEKEIETLRERLSNINRDHARVMNEQERALQAATEHDGETTEQMKDLLKRQGEQNAELRMNKDKVNNLQAELDRLRRQVHTLQQESADKEVKIVQISKQHDHAKEDLMQMNMALDSKQQELELLKRRHNVRGTAGSTSSTPAPSRVSRRDSAVFSTPSTSRPSSVISIGSDKESNAGKSTVTKERKLSSESVLPKMNTLAKSTRMNGPAPSANVSMGPPSTTKPRLAGTMGPPRMSMGTPTPIARVASLSRSTTTKPALVSSSTSSGAVAHHRRSSALAGGSGSSTTAGSMKQPSSMPSVPTTLPSAPVTPLPISNLANLMEEKENLDTLHNLDATPAKADRGDRRRSMIPTPA
ncbi:hypothetical protein HHX47_DHR8000074 [Lentinula edodes]|nr:hypothetical protein HHX47_DHR8000074 [Lentinula edodes]